MPLCNCHLTFAPGAQLASHCLALDTAMALDAKAWMLHRLGFGREKRQFMHPVGEGDIGRPPSAPWKREDNVPKDAVLMAFAAGGKTAACSAHEVRKREEGGRLASSRGV
ncbi:hypothetical protein B0J12DRAFT_699008 [Macrophomina phaseolina]|uniref:Uncharacterized protein n=1 Tax=Macrophomina phaseolina TaxID=35725 RepID=A0ABQ8GDE8_9PEZI|nr:hypothetical protein B0J12DRAFT_699008 [Macrophomina phaseolina]